MTTDLYHEKQRLQYCLIHTVNNILQKSEFDAAKMDEICYAFNESKWFNPHRSWIGTGNYDANILMAALQQHDLKVMWYDKRVPVERIHVEKVRAVVLNIPSRTLLTLYRGRHWFAVVQKNGVFYNLDSKAKEPTVIPDIRKFIGEHVESKESEVMLVVDGSVDEETVVDKNN
uniref:ubiquitinyl hydrolase 1 n=1 Tax=Caenorhabditis tropicalis TaxID=1561998 RepID=A0A1I7U8U3_9PELO